MYRLSALAAGLLFAQLAHAGHISGVVTDNQGNPIANARVSIEGKATTVLTDQNGRYELSSEPGQLHLHVTSSDFDHGDKLITLTEDHVRVDFSLAPASFENIVVSASAMHKSVLESVAPVSVLNKQTLSRRQAPTLGETLSMTPGVHSSYFGPVASSPIIRGADGPRVKVLQNGLDVSDASRIGPDHAVAVDAAIASQVEVLLGPATLQYGSSAMGGVVNVVDDRIPDVVPTALNGAVQARAGNGDNLRYLDAELNGGSGSWAWHIDGLTRTTDDVKVPAHSDEGIRHIENTHIDSNTGGLGLSYVSDNGHIGISVQDTSNSYGVPGHVHHDEEEEHEEHHVEEEHDDHDDHEAQDDHDGHEEEDVSIDVAMRRYQLVGQWQGPSQYIDSLKLSLAHTDYRHQELEGHVPATYFSNKTQEARLALTHKPFFDWHGVVGLHLSDSDYAAIGEEAFTPSSLTRSQALYLVEERQFGKLSMEFGARVEWVEVEAEETDVQRYQDTHYSYSLGANWRYLPGYGLALSATYAERAPSHQELFTGGAHLSTQTFDIGTQSALNASIPGGVAGQSADKEVSTNLDLTWRKYHDKLGYSVSLFYNEVDNYLYQQNTGLVYVPAEDDFAPATQAEGLPVYLFKQGRATFHGMELEVNYALNKTWELGLFGDYVRARVADDNLPRTPGAKLGGEVHYDEGNVYGTFSVTRQFGQRQVSDYETPTDGYTMVDLALHYQLAMDDYDLTFFVLGKNLTNTLAREHSSFIKALAPKPGRRVIIGAQLSF